jgi:hypothetical protein
MEREPEPFKTLAQDRQDALGVDKIVERYDRIVSETDKGAPPRKALPHLRLKPFIEHMVQENI